MSKAVIATLGEDRPGLVSELSEKVHALDLNIEDSRMTVLGGEFAVLMSVSGSNSALGALERELAELARDSGVVYLYRKTAARQGAPARRYTIKVETVDHPGIVHGIAAFFSERGINICVLETQTRPAPHTGAPVFNVHMEIEVQELARVEPLREAFLAFCEAEDLDGDLLLP
jgi:glycine cleavage system transcriptional repressor